MRSTTLIAWETFDVLFWHVLYLTYLYINSFLGDFWLITWRAGYEEMRNGFQQLHSSYSFIRLLDCRHVQSPLLVVTLIKQMLKYPGRTIGLEPTNEIQW